MSDADIGLVGLGTMGSALALNIAEKGFRVAVWNRDEARIGEFVAEAGELAGRIVPCTTLEALMAAIRPPRPVLLMIPSGAPVDSMIAQLQPLAGEGDILIDAGNADFRETVRRIGEFRDSAATFMGMGVSGGEEGARHGPSIMVGGEPVAWERIAPVLTAITAKYEGEPCAALLGPGGAGHFVKTIHNGIEYADMQMIAEVYGLMRDGLGMAPADISAVFAGWNGGRLNSYLIEITAKVLAVTDPQSGTPIVDLIVDAAGQKGTGRWAAIEAQHLGVPATAIEAAVAARNLSAQRAERATAAAAFPSTFAPGQTTPASDIVRELEQALLAGQIVAYAQGFAVMAEASREYGWNLPLDTIARIWRAGCIIRSQFLGEIAAAFASDAGASGNLVLAPAFAALMAETHPALRVTVGRAALQGLPVPALSAALSWFDSWRQARGTANLIQAQRDFFGAQGFERIDREGPQHGPWGAPHAG